MDEVRPSFRCSGGDRRLEIVSGKGFAGNLMYTTSRPRSPDLPSIPPYVSRSSQVAKPWGFNDPEMKRKKRIAKYKVYTIEGRFKASIKNGIRWMKNKCSAIIPGY
ncbi:unnamed protein product [Ilex paraguariensis]|uniref:DUF3511 domain-containing protein n=1 Tax=Ilex paraguariensis TaxID=185542 RepID=A0ABC8UXR0_9AQUA